MPRSGAVDAMVRPTVPGIPGFTSASISVEYSPPCRNYCANTPLSKKEERVPTADPGSWATRPQPLSDARASCPGCPAGET
jgi:hypothetical protein